MRNLSVNRVTDAVEEACIKMNYIIDEKILNMMGYSSENESSILGKSILEDLMANAEQARLMKAPLCQDTGMIVAFVTIGQEVHLEDGSLELAIQEGIRRGYEKGYLRKSIVSDPLLRRNTSDNTPGVVHYELVPGDGFEIELAAKGFGSENMSKSKMLKPSDGVQGVMDFVVDTVLAAGSNPCPPMVIGVGIGGTLDKAAQIAKRALFRPLNTPHKEAHVAALEKKLLEAVNATGIGPQGLGGLTTAFAVHVEVFPTHIAGLPVVVNINCHASRHEKVVL